MSEIISLAERLKARRVELGLSQAQAARELDVARTAYRLWELEASKPSPDRWRLIASWLGVSVTTMLIANDMVTESEAAVSDSLGGGGFASGHAAGASTGDFFSEAHTLLGGATAGGSISPSQAQQFAALLARLEGDSVAGETAQPWQPAELRRLLPATDAAPHAARQAIAFVSSGIASETMEVARLLTSELVSNSVRHAGMSPTDTIGLLVQVTRSTVHVEVSDASGDKKPVLTEPSASGGRGLHIVAALASRWGGAADVDGRKTTWFEIDLPSPGG